MKKYIISGLVCLFSTLCLSTQSNGADLIVTAGGAGGAYATLNAALTAAVAGDRIIVTPQSGGAAFAEGTIAITKSVQILSATEGTYFAIDGNINVTPASAGISVTIVGMKLLTGGIQSTIASPVGARSAINLLNDSLAAGAVSFNHNNYNLTCASNYIQSSVTFQFGKVIGNVIRDQVVVNTDASVNNPTDTVQIIGNKITYYTSANSGGITWSSTSQFFSIQNNFVQLTYPINNANYGIWVSTSKASIAGTNSIINNTVSKQTYVLYYGFPISTNATSNTEVHNNLVIASLYQYAFSFSGGNFSAHYNYANNFNWTGITNDGTNQTATNVTLNTEGLNTNGTSNIINGGNPDAAFDDTNLTRNDVGCYGGSFTLNNFFPFSSSDWSGVILVTTPRRVLVNGTIDVKAVGFDK